jgi:hypothetical protein
VKKVALHQGLDHLNSLRVPHNGCKWAAKHKTQMKKEELKNESKVAF